jgi:hypothetical protein
MAKTNAEIQAAFWYRKQQKKLGKVRFDVWVYPKTLKFIRRNMRNHILIPDLDRITAEDFRAALEAMKKLEDADNGEK